MAYESAYKSRLSAELGTTAAGHFVQTLESRNEAPALVPTAPWRVDLSSQISSATPDELCGGTVTDADAGKAVKSGLLLWNDDLDSSHTLSQSVHTVTGSYWHGIMHRREPDYSNSKYWFNRVGEHPIFPEVREAALAVATQLQLDDWRVKVETAYEWNPGPFIDWCAEEPRGKLDAAHKHFLRLVQLEEIRLLLSYSFRRARGRL